jgi:lipopolysaccharide biosynthesis glycosyltransferase
MKKSLLVTLADENYIDQAKQLFSSVYWNAGWRGDYLLLAHEIPNKKLKWFRKKGILIKKCKTLSTKTSGLGGRHLAVLSKFYMFTPEFKKWRNIVFLDADIIVRAPLDGLARVPVFAGTNLIPEKLSSYLNNFSKLPPQEFETLYNEAKNFFDLSKKGFNSGVMAFNTCVIKEDTFSELVRLYDRYNPIINIADEIPLNFYFNGNYERLPCIYNVYTSAIKGLGLDLKTFDAIIVHGMMEKMWDEKHPFYMEWKYNLDRADKIDLEKIPVPRRLSKDKIMQYSKKLRFWIEVDKCLGKAGIFIKERNWYFYLKLKKLKRFLNLEKKTK